MQQKRVKGCVTRGSEHLDSNANERNRGEGTQMKKANEHQMKAGQNYK